jgi:peptidyl-prolyl cis-trans isomerase C
MQFLKINKILILILFIGIFCYSNSAQIFAKDLYKKGNNMSEAKQFTQVRASHLLVKTEEEAINLREEIVAGKINFADAASKVSMCPSGKQGGDLGFFGRGRMVPEFDQAAFSLPVGEISQPIQTQFGWHLLVVTDQK